MSEWKTDEINALIQLCQLIGPFPSQIAEQFQPFKSFDQVCHKLKQLNLYSSDQPIYSVCFGNGFPPQSFSSHANTIDPANWYRVSSLIQSNILKLFQTAEYFTHSSFHVWMERLDLLRQALPPEFQFLADFFISVCRPVDDDLDDKTPFPNPMVSMSITHQAMCLECLTFFMESTLLSDHNKSETAAIYSQMQTNAYRLFLSSLPDTLQSAILPKHSSKALIPIKPHTRHWPSVLCALNGDSSFPAIDLGSIIVSPSPSRGMAVNPPPPPSILPHPHLPWINYHSGVLNNHSLTMECGSNESSEGSHNDPPIVGRTPIKRLPKKRKRSFFRTD